MMRQDESLTMKEQIEQDYLQEAHQCLERLGFLDNKEKVALALLRLDEDWDDPVSVKAWDIWDSMGLNFLHAYAVTDQWNKFHQWAGPRYEDWDKRFNKESY